MVLKVSCKAQLVSLISQFFLLTRQCRPRRVSLNILNSQYNRLYYTTIPLLKQKNFKSRKTATLHLKWNKILDKVRQEKKKFSKSHAYMQAAVLNVFQNHIPASRFKQVSCQLFSNHFLLMSWYVNGIRKFSIKRLLLFVLIMKRLWRNYFGNT